MFLRNHTSRRGRALIVAVVTIIFLAAVVAKHTPPAPGFYSWIEQHPTICQIVRPLFVIVGRGVEFDSHVQWATFGRLIMDLDQGNAYRLMLCPSDTTTSTE